MPAGHGVEGPAALEQEKMGKGIFPEMDKGLPLDSEEANVALRQMALYKSKHGNSVLG